MRASNDFFVVGIAGIGTALFLTQLLIVSQQIIAARNHVQEELDAEKSAVPVNWINTVRRPPPPVEYFHQEFNPPPSPPRMHLVYPQGAAAGHVGGFVDFDLTINRDGFVVSSKVVAEVPRGYGFAAAAAKALSNWRFNPVLNAHKSKPTITRFRVTFKPDN